MLNALFGWYVQENLNGRYISLVFKASLDADEKDTLTLDDVGADAEDAAKIKKWLVGDNFILTDIWTYAVPGNVALTILPDSDTTKQFYVEAVNEPLRIPISPPKLVETNLSIDFTNENQPNDLFIIIGAIRISESNTAKFTLLSELIPTSIENIDLQTLSILKSLLNIEYQNNAIIQQGNITILQSNELIKASGGTPLELPDGIVMPPVIHFPPDVVNPPETIDYYERPVIPPERVAGVFERVTGVSERVAGVCKRRPTTAGTAKSLRERLRGKL
ncbi:MAG: hypothetical protein Q8J68_08015 [Methanolobus sp.]|uniref:hypothetical protein n=1 Tax=Methanolobus sp. TaxID=1874737 RepID=UPI0027301D29|nr:hypothetical protein [Methanolobus sp.]MDP2217214.1 hypothetical protein [Methanolobus sp.]